MSVVTLFEQTTALPIADAVGLSPSAPVFRSKIGLGGAVKIGALRRDWRLVSCSGVDGSTELLALGEGC